MGSAPLWTGWTDLHTRKILTGHVCAVTAPGTDSSLNFKLFLLLFPFLSLVKYCQHYQSGKECEVKSFESKVEKTRQSRDAVRKVPWEGWMLQEERQVKERED